MISTTRLALFAVATVALATFGGPGFADDLPKGEPPTKPTDPVVTKANAGDVNGTISKVALTQISLKIPQQVPNGFTTQSVKVPNPLRSGHPQTYTTVHQQVPKFKIVQNEVDFTVADAVKVTTETGRKVEYAALKPGMPTVLHLTRVKEGKPNEKGEVHLEVTAILVPNASVPAVPPATKSK